MEDYKKSRKTRNCCCTHSFRPHAFITMKSKQKSNARNLHLELNQMQFACRKEAREMKMEMAQKSNKKKTHFSPNFINI